MLFCMGSNEKYSKYCIFLKILSYIWQKMPDKAVKYPNMGDYRKRTDWKRKGSLGVAG